MDPKQFTFLKTHIDRCERSKYYFSFVSGMDAHGPRNFETWLQTYVIGSPIYAEYETVLRMWHAAKYGEPR